MCASWRANSFSKRALISYGSRVWESTRSHTSGYEG